MYIQVPISWRVTAGIAWEAVPDGGGSAPEWLRAQKGRLACSRGIGWE